MATTKVSGELVDLNEATSESGLKIPTGTQFNRPATDVAGMIRNNTNETSEGSASCEEYYSGSAWKKINNVTPPPPAFGFKNILYSGNSSTQAITGVGFKPDWVWIKERGPSAENHNLYDSSRGVRNFIVSNSTAANVFGSAQRLNAFDSDGFTLGSDNEINDSGSTYVAWCWKANGGTTESNTNGTITSTVQASEGFSIVKWTGTGAQGTIGHGLSSAPELIISKRLDSSNNWNVYQKDLGFSHTSYPNWLYLNVSTAEQSSGSSANHPYYQTPSSTLIYQNTGTSESANVNGGEYISYCFASVTGKIVTGKYTGDGNANGPTITIGFQPDWLLVKRLDTGDTWRILDSARSTSNPRNDYLDPDSTQAEASSVFSNVDFNSDNFQLKTLGSNYNNNGGLYMYLAFKE
jgi:hypothetical protein